MNKQELQTALQHFTGTESYHKFNMFSNLLATDGAMFLAESAGAYWLLDIIASVGDKLENFNILNMEVADNKAKVIIDNGYSATDEDEKEYHKLIHEQKIPFTDFPLDSIKLYIQDGIVMLASEY